MNPASWQSYTQPEKRAAKRAALDAKLKDAGKPTLAEMRKQKPCPSGHPEDLA